MTDLADLADVVPATTAAAWRHVAAIAPADAVLMGGTGLAVHLRHRISRDLDLFTEHEFDPDHIEEALWARGTFATTLKSEGTLNGILDETKIQFLWARTQRTIEAPDAVSGLNVGSLSDIFATKVKVIGDRGELRDYFDLMVIEQQTGRTIEEGLALYMHRYGVEPTHPSIDAIQRGLGYFDDVVDDPYLAAAHGADVRDSVIQYWTDRQRSLATNLDPRHPDGGES